MRCPKCQYENPDKQEFCGDCGAPLPRSAELTSKPTLPCTTLAGDVGMVLSGQFQSTVTVDQTSHTGAGATGRDHATVAGQGGAAIGRDVLGDVLVNSVKNVLGRDEEAAAQRILERYLQWVIAECAPLRLMNVKKILPLPPTVAVAEFNFQSS